MRATGTGGWVRVWGSEDGLEGAARAGDVKVGWSVGAARSVCGGDGSEDGLWTPDGVWTASTDGLWAAEQGGARTVSGWQG